MIDKILELKKRCNFSNEIGKAFNLTLGEVECISTIAGHGSLSSKHLSTLMELSPSRGSRIVSRLMQKGLIQGLPDEHDRRCISLTLSEAGELCYRKILEEKRLCEERILNELDDNQRKTVAAGLDLLLSVM